MNFVNNNIKSYITNNVINTLFPRLNSTDSNLLLELLTDLINTIAIKFTLYDDRKDSAIGRASFLNQLKSANNRDFKTLLMLLLPATNNTDTLKKTDIFARISRLSDIYMTKDSEGKYIFGSAQYARCKKKIVSPQVAVYASDSKFSENHLRENLALLKDTIQIVAHKLHVNWTNILPISPYKYRDTVLFNTTLTHLREKRMAHWDLKNNRGRNYNGLYLGDIYNTISIDLYQSIKRVKWLIYEIAINDSRPIPYIVILNEILTLDNIWAEIPWLLLSSTQKNVFTNEWKAFVQHATRKQPIDLLTGEDLFRLLTGISIFFCADYKHMKQSQENKFIDPELLDDEVANENFDTKERKDAVLEIMELPPEQAYRYILSSATQLKRTWYGSVMLEHNGTHYFLRRRNAIKELPDMPPTQKLLDFQTAQQNFKKFSVLEHFHFNNLPIEIYLTMKNMFNFSEHFCRFGWETPIKYWSELINFRRADYNVADFKGEINLRDEIIARLYSIFPDAPEETRGWFHLVGYIRQTYSIADRLVGAQLETVMLQVIGSNIMDVVFQSLCCKGALTRFEPATEMKKKIPQVLFTELEEKKQYDIKNAYYFVTRQQYQYLQWMDINEKKKISYFNFLKKQSIGGSWIYRFTVNWVSQLQIFHHYLNNRVMFVTGGTGIGKSTTLPRLLLYGMTVFDYNQCAKIAITQPRIQATIQIAETTSLEMGVPISVYHPTLKKKIESNNYFVQFQYSLDSHTSNNNLEPSILFATDGLLLQQIVGNGLLKHIANYRFSTRNLYDMVVIDEAHEHNTNMDLICTIAKHFTYYNNSIRFVIMTATIDVDEPRYYSYYACINDNLIYPVNTLLEFNQLDRLNVFRRIHIEDISEVTRRVTEVYSTDPPIKVFNSELVVKRCILKALSIMKTSRVGNILIFLPGRKEITKAVTILNQKIPTNTIALPFYSDHQYPVDQLHDGANLGKITINKLDANLHISRSSSEVRSDAQEDEDQDNKKIELHPKVPVNTYQRAIIIATDIAEASLTLANLRYIIDCGYRKSSVLRPNGLKELIDERISEVSRVQRRGRGGRTGDPCTIYYMYPQKDPDNPNKPFTRLEHNYHITSEYMDGIVFNLLSTSSPVARVLLFTAENNPCDILNRDKLSKNNFAEYYGGTIPQITNFLQQQYHDYYNYPISYYGHENVYIPKSGDTYSVISPHSFANNGFLLDETIMDNDGSFYLIHPDENELKRDFRTDCIIEVNNTKINDISDYVGMNKKLLNNNKIEIATSNLQDKLLVVIDHEVKRKKSYRGDNPPRKKTLFGQLIGAMIQSIDIESFIPADGLSILVTLFYSIPFNCEQELTLIFPALEDIISTNGSVFSMCDYITHQGKESRYQVNQHFSKLWGNKYSDYITILNITKRLATHVDEIITSHSEHVSAFKSQFETVKNDWASYYQNQIKSSQSRGITLGTNNVEMFELINKLFRQKNLINIDDLMDNKSITNHIEHRYTKSLLYSSEKLYLPKLLKWCQQYYVDFDFAKKYIRNYIDHYFKFQNLLKAVVPPNIDPLSQKTLREYITEINVYENKNDKPEHRIIKCLLKGFCNKIACLNNQDHNYYIITSPEGGKLQLSKKIITYPLGGFIMYQLTTLAPQQSVLLSNLRPEWLLQTVPYTSFRIIDTVNNFPETVKQRIYHELSIKTKSGYLREFMNNYPDKSIQTHMKKLLRQVQHGGKNKIIISGKQDGNKIYVKCYLAQNMEPMLVTKLMVDKSNNSVIIVSNKLPRSGLNKIIEKVKKKFLSEYN